MFQNDMAVKAFLVNQTVEIILIQVRNEFGPPSLEERVGRTMDGFGAI